jgi:pimeloyl-ACP methyl ester carboxylesterase
MSPPQTVIFIGGAADKYPELGFGPTWIVGRIWDRFRQRTPPHTQSFFLCYRERQQCLRLIRQLLRDNPTQRISLVGHSRGAAMALTLAGREANRENIPLHRLISLDPVGQSPLTPHLCCPNRSPLQQVGQVINLKAQPRQRNYTDWVAWLGGPWGDRACHLADRHFEVNCNHAEAWRMLNIPLAIAPGIYQSCWDLLHQA